MGVVECMRSEVSRHVIRTDRARSSRSAIPRASTFMGSPATSRPTSVTCSRFRCHRASSGGSAIRTRTRVAIAGPLFSIVREVVPSSIDFTERTWPATTAAPACDATTCERMSATRDTSRAPAETQREKDTLHKDRRAAPTEAEETRKPLVGEARRPILSSFRPSGCPTSGPYLPPEAPRRPETGQKKPEEPHAEPEVLSPPTRGPRGSGAPPQGADPSS